MNNTQLYLSIGVPTLTVILAWLSNRPDITRLNDKVDKLNESLRADMLSFRREVAAEMIAFRREVHGDLIMLHDVWSRSKPASPSDTRRHFPNQIAPILHLTQSISPLPRPMR